MSEYKANVKNEIDERGRFIRQGNLFTTPFGEKEGELKAEAGGSKKYRRYDKKEIKEGRY